MYAIRSYYEPILSSRLLDAEHVAERHVAAAAEDSQRTPRQHELHTLTVALDIDDDVFAGFACA